MGTQTGGERYKKRRCRRTGWSVLLLSAVLCTALLLLVPAKDAEAFDAVTEIEVTVGYFGSDRDYVKATPSIDDLKDACGTDRVIYTYINAGQNPGTIEAEGIYISDIMDYCGVEMSTVDGYNFFTQDAGYQGRIKSWTNEELFGARYACPESFRQAYEDYETDHEDYIRNWQAHYTVYNFFDFSNGAFLDEAWSVREQVEPMLGLRVKSTKWTNAAPGSALDFSGLYDITPTLYFGQASPGEKTAANMAQHVYKINIRYEGKPVIEVNQTAVSGEAGTQG